MPYTHRCLPPRYKLAILHTACTQLRTFIGYKTACTFKTKQQASCGALICEPTVTSIRISFRYLNQIVCAGHSMRHAICHANACAQANAMLKIAADEREGSVSFMSSTTATMDAHVLWVDRLGIYLYIKVRSLI